MPGGPRDGSAWSGGFVVQKESMKKTSLWRPPLQKHSKTDDMMIFGFHRRKNHPLSFPCTGGPAVRLQPGRVWPVSRGQPLLSGHRAVCAAHCSHRRAELGWASWVHGNGLKKRPSNSQKSCFSVVSYLVFYV